MKITPNAPLSKTNRKKSVKSKQADQGFMDAMHETESAQNSEESKKASSIQSTSMVGSVIFVQDETSDEERGSQIGHQLLNQLEVMQRDMLMGRLNIQRLKQMQATIAQISKMQCGQGLKQILQEIELRVSVELAKYDR